MDSLTNIFAAIDLTEFFEWLKRHHSDDDLIEIISKHTGFEVFKDKTDILDEFEYDVLKDYLTSDHSAVVFDDYRERDEYVEENALCGLNMGGIQDYRRVDCIELINKIIENRGWEDIYTSLSLLNK